MARTKLDVNSYNPLSGKADLDLTNKLGQAFDKIIERDFNQYRAPSPYVTPFGISHIDALLGGGIVSSGVVMLSSTPETGKSTFAFQFSKMFQDTYDNSIIVYLDIEGSGNSAEESKFKINRIEGFGLDSTRFKYQPFVVNVMELFEVVNKLVEIKKQFEDKLNKEFYVLVVWDSIASTPSSKVNTAEDQNSVIGLKARQLSFCLEKYTPMLKFNRITFMGIDQVRANISMEGPYAQKEKSVGNFKDMKSASNIYALQHNVQQWIYLSKGKKITRSDGMGVDGWYINMITEKNKLAPSQNIVTCVFDKNHGIDKFWSEFVFLMDQLPQEKKLYGTRKMPCPLMVGKSGPQVYLNVVNPDDPSISYKSENFYRKNAKEKYKNDELFRQWFDYAVEISVMYRIINGIMQVNLNESATSNDVEEEVTPQEEYDPETGEVLEFKNSEEVEDYPNDD